MKKSSKVIRHQNRLKNYHLMRRKLKNWRQEIHEERDSHHNYGISRRIMRWRAMLTQGGWREGAKSHEF